MFDIKSDSGFTDGNRQSVKSLDVVEYRYGQRRGILLEALQDGDAYVAFRDTKSIETVKWKDLCKVPEFFSIPQDGASVMDESQVFKRKCSRIEELKDQINRLPLDNSLADAIYSMIRVTVEEYFTSHMADFQHKSSHTG